MTAYTIFFLPVINEMTTKARKIKNKTFAIPAAPAAIPPNPKIAAIIANTTKTMVHFNIMMILVIINIFKLAASDANIRNQIL